LNQNDFLDKVKAFSCALWHGQIEKVLAAMVFGLFGAAVYLRQEWKQFSQVAYLVYERRHTGTLTIYWPRVALRKLERTSNQEQRARLRAEYENLEQIPQDESVYDFNNEVDLYGCSSSYPLISDDQDESIRRELEAQGIDPGDAQHITQAVCNNCDVFLTRDGDSIISQRHWIEECSPGLIVRRPTELLEELR